MSLDQRKQFELQQQAEQQAKAEALAERKKQVKVESDLTQTMIKQNPLQFSAFAIPAYDRRNCRNLLNPLSPD